MQQIDLTILKGAIFSEDRKYRYALWRMWHPTLKPLMCIGLNPSTANELTNDPTITRNIARAYKSGFGGLIMANLYAYVSTDPNALLKDGDFVGEFNDYYITQMIALSGQVLCGWGSFKPVIYRAPIVLNMIKEPFCLGINIDSQPKHPLYVSYNTPMVKYLPDKIV
jgi:hypothetical protein